MANVKVCDRSGSVLCLYLVHVLVTCMHGIAKDTICANLDPPVTVLYMIDRFICVHSVETLAGLKI